jgi:hypothetical protein
MDPAIVVALIGVAGTTGLAVLNHMLQRRRNDPSERIDDQSELRNDRTGQRNDQNERTDEQSDRGDELFVMSDELFAHLRRLATGSYGAYWVDPEMRYGLGPELTHLKVLGFIRFDVDPAVSDIREMPKGEQPELSRYISVTGAGREFIRRRTSINRRRDAGR